MACNGLKKRSFHLFVHPKWSWIIFGETKFLPIFDPFFLPKRTLFKAFWNFRRAKTGYHEVKTWHSMWSGIIFEKSHFFGARWILLTHFGTHLFGLLVVSSCMPLGLGTWSRCQLRVEASVRAILRAGNHQKRVVVGGLGVLEITF